MDTFVLFVFFVLGCCSAFPSVVNAKPNNNQYSSRSHHSSQNILPPPEEISLALVPGGVQTSSSSSEEEVVSVNFSPETFSFDQPPRRDNLTSPEKQRQLGYYDPFTLQSFNESNSSCRRRLDKFHADFDAEDVFPNLGFQDSWIRHKAFWYADDFDFEARYRNKFDPDGITRTRPPRIKVFVVPHSHCDPGWLQTFEGYFNSQVHNIFDLAVEKLNMYPNMTFVWNEISFLSLWWKNKAKISQKIQFLNLIKEGRLEILTGGWVMADEATVNLYSLMDELIEGRQWTQNFLGVVPNISWSIDPFGHGSTMPYLLKSAGIDNMVIQRIHYAWKKYLAQKQYGNFKWVQRWDVNNEHGITCHNAPYDVYTTKHTCGPNPEVCLRVDFRNIPGEYSEYMRYARPVREIDIDSLASDLVGQFQRTASLSPSKAVLFPLGDDFRFDKSEEWDQQYENYVPLMRHINDNFDRFGVEIRFGTVSDYFRELNAESQNRFPKFSGDFLPYSDIFVSARPAYWTGFYGTRPYWKKFYRETESHLRSAEILFSYAYNLAINDNVMSMVLKQEYQNLVQGRKYLALFAHHDGATGTSRRHTMNDYGSKLMQTTRFALRLQRHAIRAIMQQGLNVTVSALGIDRQILSFGELPTTAPRIIYEDDSIVKKILLFNSLSFKRIQLVRVQVTNPIVKVVGPNRENIISQINPVVEPVGESLVISSSTFELSFLAQLEPLALHAFEIRKVSSNDRFLARSAQVACRGCQPIMSDKSGGYGYFEVENVTMHTIVIGNREQDLYLNGTTGLLRRVVVLKDEVSIPAKVQFGGYSSNFRDSGAYLLSPDLSSPVQIPYDDINPANVIVVEGPVTSYVTAYNNPIRTTTRLLGVPNQGVHIENGVDLAMTAAEVFMRVDTWLNSTTVSSSPRAHRQPTMFTDQNGYTMEKRVKVPEIGYPGNVYPVNTMVYIQDVDNRVRFTWMVDRAHGFNSMHHGRLETLIERRTIFDDGRGMSEGVTDNRPTLSNYIFFVERLDEPLDLLNPKDPKDYRNNLPTLQALHLSLALMYSSPTFGYDDNLGGYLGTYSILTKSMPEDSHILTLRTISNVTHHSSTSYEELETPSQNALLVVQKLGFLSATLLNQSCPLININNTRPPSHPFINNNSSGSSDLFQMGTKFTKLDINSADVTDLAGVLGVRYTGRRSTLPIIERNPFEITTLHINFREHGRRRGKTSTTSGHHQNQNYNSTSRGNNNNHRGSSGGGYRYERP